MTILNRGKYLEDLGLDPRKDHSPESLKKAWKNLCKKHHPDKGGDVDEFHKVTVAYKMLTDEEFAKHYSERTPAKKNSLDINVRFPLTFAEAYFGVQFCLNISVTEFDGNFEPIKNDSPKIEILRCHIGAGSVQPQPIIFNQKGMIQGEHRGSVIITPMVEPDRRFQIQQTGFGRQYILIHQKQLPLSVMLKGGRVKVDTMHGEKEVWVNSGTQPGAKIALPKDGMIIPHIIEVSPKFPDMAELQSEEWSGLDIDWSRDPVEEDVETLDFMDVWRRINEHRGT